MNLRGFLIGKYVLLCYIEFTAAMLEKIQNIVHTAEKVKDIIYKRQYLTGSSFYRSVAGKILMFLDR